MDTFKIGHFVRLKDLRRWATTRLLYTDVNVFRINQLKDDQVILEHVVEPVSLSDIEPVPIDGIADKSIYYDPVPAATVVTSGATVKGKTRNTLYYFKRFEKCLNENGQTFQQLVKEPDCKYVHEVQDLLRDHFGEDKLRINAI